MSTSATIAWVTGGQEQVIFEGRGCPAGLEIVGPIQEIQKLARVI